LIFGEHRNQTGLDMAARSQSTAQTRLVLPHIDSDDSSNACRCSIMEAPAAALKRWTTRTKAAYAA
jgi:hypothetical protein